MTNQSQISEKERKKRNYLLSRPLVWEPWGDGGIVHYEFPEFLSHLDSLTFQVWCMMQNPRELLSASQTVPFRELSRRVYNKNPFLRAYDWLWRLLFCRECLWSS